MIIYIDGSHITKDVMVDAVYSWELLKEGGILLFDDLEWRNIPLNYMTPKPAIEAFLHAYNGLFEIKHIGYQLHILKIADHPTSQNFQYKKYASLGSNFLLKDTTKPTKKKKRSR